MRDTYGILIKGDQVLIEFIKHLDSNRLADKFIIAVVDPRHLFIKNTKGIVEYLQEQIDDWQDEFSFTFSQEELGLPVSRKIEITKMVMST
mmetsp:Transcript_30915/g.75400  ORF Transcript_30915/g.75400 Transcript_30915/m.75400 type:complete len:91 (+) Transcript_30915:2-274(+)